MQKCVSGQEQLCCRDDKDKSCGLPLLTHLMLMITSCFKKVTHLSSLFLNHKWPHLPGYHLYTGWAAVSRTLRVTEVWWQLTQDLGSCAVETHKRKMLTSAKFTSFWQNDAVGEMLIFTHTKSKSETKWMYSRIKSTCTTYQHEHQWQELSEKSMSSFWFIWKKTRRQISCSCCYSSPKYATKQFRQHLEIY